MLKMPRFPLVMHTPSNNVDYYMLDIDAKENIVFGGGLTADK
jgi:hypothetical protein